MGDGLRQRAWDWLSGWLGGGSAPAAWDDAVYWALDLETSGLDARRHCVVSVGMVPVRHGTVRWGERFYSLVRPPSFDGLDDAAITVHHIVPQELHRAPLLADVLPQVAARLAGAVLLLHHAPLDLAFLRRGFAEHDLDWPQPPVVDTRLLVARLEDRLRRIEPHARPLPRGLSDVRALLGLPVYEAHHALTDALATAELFLALRARLEATQLRHLARGGGRGRVRIAAPRPPSDES